uniref:Putative secreted protein n=1 Tax=Ixodes ricinus TaxID=34613 RepID=A0A6B0UBQ8_IXORI
MPNPKHVFRQLLRLLPVTCVSVVSVDDASAVRFVRFDKRASLEVAVHSAPSCIPRLAPTSFLTGPSSLDGHCPTVPVTHFGAAPKINAL